MAGYEGEPERAWDEYDWERFLQQQDQKTEKYMELLENYLDDPHRDQIIAREMGWTQLLESKDWSAEVDALLADEAREDLTTRPRSEYRIGDRRLRGSQPVSRCVCPDDLDRSTVRRRQLRSRIEPAAVKLATHSALASAKLAAALSDDDVDEIGMTIAYLKRALKAITISMEAAAQLLSEKLITSLAAFRPATAAFPGPRRHHYPDGRVPRRVASALRQPQGSRS